MALDAYRGGDAVTDVDYTRILAGADEYSRPFCRKPAKMDPRRLVGAVLAPHDRDHRELERVRTAAQDLDQVLELAVCQAECPVQVLNGLDIRYHFSESIKPFARPPDKAQRHFGITDQLLGFPLDEQILTVYKPTSKGTGAAAVPGRRLEAEQVSGLACQRSPRPPSITLGSRPQAGAGT